MGLEQPSTQSGNFTTESMANIYIFTIIKCDKTMTWKFHVDESTEGRHDMIIGRDLLNTLGINIKLSYNTIDYGKGTYQGCTTTMADLNNYDFNFINGNMREFSEELFLNSYINKCYSS